MDKIVDENRVTRVPVKTYGPFAFSRWYDDRLNSSVLEALVRTAGLNSLPILPAWSAKLNEDLIVRSIFGTAAIEGSPLTEAEVSGLLASGGKVTPKAARERTILNLREAFRLAGVGAGTVESSKPTVTEERIRQLHIAISRGLNDETYFLGAYRVTRVEVGDTGHGGKYKPPKVAEDISMLMGRFVEWVNSDALREQEHPVIRAFLAHYHLALIHPFADGNGRLARVVEAELLEKAGLRYVSLMMSNYYYENIDDYYRAFTTTEKSGFDMTPFLEFCLAGLLKSLKNIQGRITLFIRRLALREHYATLRGKRALTRRQHDFLLLLLDHGLPFALADLASEPKFRVLYGDVTGRTARRDLARLKGMGLLNQPEPGFYRLNIEAIG